MQEPRVTIHMGTRRDGHIFGLRPRSRDWLEEHYPDRARIPAVHIHLNEVEDFYQIPEPILDNIFNMVTGLSHDELDEIGFIVDNPALGKEIYSSVKAYV